MQAQEKLKLLLTGVDQDAAIKGLQVYIVGGAVRDTLLGIETGDKDWVVVGASPSEMIKRKFIPVGSQFPVFLHPVTKQEYALARTERKTGLGYKGFTFYTGKDVSLEQDLVRRDLTINAIALDKNANLIDPFNGVQDIKDKTLRHVGPAFSEDPVRLLRLARFLARFVDFNVANETLGLANDLVNAGEVDALVPERIWQEISKGLMAEQPSRMFEILHQTNALSRIIPELNWHENSPKELSCMTEKNLPLASRFAVLVRQSTDLGSLCKNLRASNECKDYALLLPVLYHMLKDLTKFEVKEILNILIKSDAVRRPQRFIDLIKAFACINKADLMLDLNFWQKAINQINSVDGAAIAKSALGDTAKIKENIYKARLLALGNLKDDYVYP